MTFFFDPPICLACKCTERLMCINRFGPFLLGSLSVSQTREQHVSNRADRRIKVYAIFQVAKKNIVVWG